MDRPRATLVPSKPIDSANLRSRGEFPVLRIASLRNDNLIVSIDVSGFAANFLVAADLGLVSGCIVDIVLQSGALYLRACRDDDIQEHLMFGPAFECWDVAAWRRQTDEVAELVKLATDLSRGQAKAFGQASGNALLTPKWNEAFSILLRLAEGIRTEAVVCATSLIRLEAMHLFKPGERNQLIKVAELIDAERDQEKRESLVWDWVELLLGCKGVSLA